ncbi:MAG: hypothetical protein ACTSVV_07940 [Promethearchaeota archaeon]
MKKYQKCIYYWHSGYCVKKERDIEEVRCRFCKDFKHFKKIRDG